jgi:hypothetical protein
MVAFDRKYDRDAEYRSRDEGEPAVSPIKARDQHQSPQVDGQLRQDEQQAQVFHAAGTLFRKAGL